MAADVSDATAAPVELQNNCWLQAVNGWHGKVGPFGVQPEFLATQLDILNPAGNVNNSMGVIVSCSFMNNVTRGRQCRLPVSHLI
jgi:hypothetical protein